MEPSKPSVPKTKILTTNRTIKNKMGNRASRMLGTFRLVAINYFLEVI
ncbi:hypothetical protein A33Q_0676 [Indibacter alkaliphilus LW1]|uniref:Uncharacterized protein n=1 Tax=Indibacter alkaliphilus (strain CCUG 57479 / KCTC 22604 / LW1) TaxID=1189612 RepID=S2EAE2_INDAL|nr:hypothetical protein A33Q_0676 [Indibacter alkaliphilus LW1]